MRSAVALVLALAAGGMVPPQAPAPTQRQPAAVRLVLKGTLTDRDLNRLFERTFQVPSGTGAIDVQVTHTDADRRTVLDVGVRGPAGMRGWSGGRTDPIHIDRLSATLGYVPGAIEPGDWAVMLGVPNIRPGVESAYTITITLSDRGHAPERPVLQTGPGWFAGDLHTHSGHSDGYRVDRVGRRWPVAVADIVASAAENGLEFLAVSDHNTASHWRDVDLIQPSTSVLLLHAREITTYRGHLNAIGERRFTDFRIGPARPMQAMLAEVGGDGAFLSINHSWLPDDERCMGCGWMNREEQTVQLVRGVEVANGDVPGRADGWQFWADMLNRGERLVAVGGSDSHNPAARPVGHPTTVVYAAALSEVAIVEGLKSGRVYIRTSRTDGPALDLTASGSTEAVMGGAITPGRVRLQANISGAAGQRLFWYRRGLEASATAIPSNMEMVSFTTDAIAGDWFAVIVRDEAGPTLLSNAIYVAAR